MATGRVVLYFEKQEDAVQFTLAASKVLSGEEPVRVSDAMEKVAREICKASRITTNGALNHATGNDRALVTTGQCA